MNNKFKQGFSLTELLVAMAIMSIIFILTMDILSRAIKIESRVLAGEAMFEQANYLLDYMSKDIRMAARFDGFNNASNCNLPEDSKFDDSEGIRFMSQRHDCVKYYLETTTENGKQYKQVFLKMKKYDAENSIYLPEYDLPLTSRDFIVNALEFEVLNPMVEDLERSKVRVYLEMESRKFDDIKLKLQTTVSTRNRD